MTESISTTDTARNQTTNMPLFDTFIFDLDGTLLDTLPDLVALTNTALQQAGFPTRTAEEIKSFVGNGARALMYQAVPADTNEQGAEAAMDRWLALYSTVGDELTQAYPYIPEVLSALKDAGCKLAVLSNKFDGGVKQVIGNHLPGYFTVLHGECDDIPRKPNPAGLLRTIKELNSSPERTVYVGDSSGDVVVSRNAGVFALGVAWGYHGGERLREAGADAVISDARELLQFAEPLTKGTE